MTQPPTLSETLAAFRSELSARYHLERELGRGGMATVYLARDLSSECLVAIKVLNPELAASLGAERFLREIDVGKQLRHPNIVGVLDSGSADGKLYYTMPYVEGASLRDRLDREKQLPIDETIALAGQIADALDYAHAQGVIHRDIKPENILLHEGRAMVADFGIARAVQLAGGSSLTSTGSSIGTPAYMSPEQPLNSKDVTPESDVYSLGCVIYELLIGEPPFSGPNALALLARHSLERVPSLKIVRASVPDAVEDAIMRAMAKVPADRFRTASAFARALTDDAGAARRRAWRARRRRPRMIAAGIAVPLLAGAAWLAWPKGANGPIEAKTETPPATGGVPPATMLGPLTANKVAVLYLDDRTPSHSLRHIADGLTEELITDLRRVAGTRVASANGSRLFRGKVVGIDSIAHALDVGVVVRGAVSPVGDNLRVTVHVIDASSSREIASATILKPRADAVALHRELTREVSAALHAVLGEQFPVLTTTGAETRDTHAWEAFLRAKQAIAEGDSLRGAGNSLAAMTMWSRADTALEAVGKMDPKWVAPPAHRGMLHYRLARQGLATSQGIQAIARWIDAGLMNAKRAVSLAPTDADALEARGSLHYLQFLLNLTPPAEADKTLASAEADLVASTKANPSQASAMNVLSHLYSFTVRTVEGNVTALSAYRADPYTPGVINTLFRLFRGSIDIDDAQMAKQWCDEGARRFPKDYRFVECRLWQLTLPDQQPPPTATQIWKTYDAYVTAAGQVDRLVPRRGLMLAAIALTQAGLKDSARAVIARAQGDASIDPAGDLVQLEAMARAQLGEKTLAMKLLRSYEDAHPRQFPSFEKGPDETWWFKSLDEPR